MQSAGENAGDLTSVIHAVLASAGDFTSVIHAFFVSAGENAGENQLNKSPAPHDLHVPWRGAGDLVQVKMQVKMQVKITCTNHLQNHLHQITCSSVSSCIPAVWEGAGEKVQVILCR